MGEAKSLARQYVGKRSQLNQVLREKYGVDLNSTEEALQQRREAMDSRAAGGAAIAEGGSRDEIKRALVPLLLLSKDKEIEPRYKQTCRFCV